ncbi:HD domain-containing protein [Pleomorphochaeta sp. DL1XJH-081]|uniref:HD domain-containing protein n=1 Tax=Pleomorphochaeta sp. DL1XJH-081 TaxID=3409690 RepID=UPI003BB62146
MDSTHIEQYVLSRISSRRYAHCLSTAIEMQRLIQRFSPDYQDLEGAYIAGIWHDIAREWNDSFLLQYCLKHAIIMESEEYRHPMLLHGAVAAHLLSVRLASVPETWKSAIRWHTIGSPAMGILGAILYIADYMEPLRTHLEEGERDTLLQCDTLEQICLSVVHRHLLHLESKGKTHAVSTMDLLDFLEQGGVFV